MRIAWVTRSFLDYRIPVYAELSRLVDDEFVLIYNRDVVSERVCGKAEAALGERAVGLTGERHLGAKSYLQSTANSRLRIPWQPGLAREIRRHNPDVVISDGFFQWTAAALWLRARHDIPHVMCYERTAHTERNAQWYRKAYRKLVMRWIDAVCCSGRLCGEYTQSLGFPAERLTYGHMVADVEGLQKACADVTDDACDRIRDAHSLPGVVFLYVGRVTKMKGILQLLDVWLKFVDKHDRDTATLVLIGDGPERETAERFCRGHHLDSVRFLGHVNYDDLAAYYAVADIFVIPTLEDNWSLVVPEAMACGLPILCSKYNGCWPELVTERNGWVFDPLDQDDFVSALDQCLKSSEGFQNMGTASREIIGRHTAKQAAGNVFQACLTAIDR